MVNTVQKFDTRSAIAIIWTFACIWFIGYILVRFGDQKEILTLIIGLISGTILGSIFGTYFGATPTNKPNMPAGSSSAEITASITTEPPPDKKDQ